MGLTISDIKNDCTGEKRFVYATITFDTSYADGGEELVPGDVGMDHFDMVIVTQKSGYTFEYDYTNEKLLAYWYDYDGGADAVAIVVTATTNMSTVAARGMFIGH